jgi:hypothetical protein
MLVLGSGCASTPGDGEPSEPAVGTETDAFNPSSDPASGNGHVQITMKAIKLLEARGMLPDILKSAENRALVIYGNNFADRSSSGWPNGSKPTAPMLNRMSARVPDNANFVYKTSQGSFQFDAKLTSFPWDDPTVTTTATATIAWVPGKVDPTHDPQGDFLSDSLRLLGNINVDTDVIADVPLSGLSCVGAVFGASECQWVEPDPTNQDLSFTVDNMYHYAYADLRDSGVPFSEEDTALRLYPFFREHVPGYDGGETAQDVATKLSDALRGQTLLGGADYGAQKYGAILYQLARRFFVGSTQPEPDLAQLIKVGNDVGGWHTGWMQGHGGLSSLMLDFPHTYLGGMPYVCGAPPPSGLGGILGAAVDAGRAAAWATTADPCATGRPTWPGWIKASPPQSEADLQALEQARPGRSDRAGLIYLGWAVHMMQDSALPHHVAGWTGKEHAFQDALGDRPYYYQDYAGMTVPKTTCLIPGGKFGPYGCKTTQVPHPYAQYSSYLVDKALVNELDDLLGPAGATKSRSDICQSRGIQSGDGTATDLNWRAVYPLYTEVAGRAYQARQEQIPAADVLGAGLSYVKNAVLGSIKLLLCGPAGDENLALNRPALQSTDLDGYAAYANLANDGNRSGNFWDGSVTHTSNGYTYGQPGWPGQFWYVDLGAERVVNAVNIYNRTDCCSERLSHYNILAYDPNYSYWKVISDHSSDDTSGTPYFHWPIEQVKTRYVMIAKTDDNYLSLAEVEVMGF